MKPERRHLVPEEDRELMSELKRRAGLPKPQKVKQNPPISEFIAEHAVVSGDTLSGIALQYYKSGAKDKWMLIYEANKDVIGDNPSLIQLGQVFKIPRLPED